MSIDGPAGVGKSTLTQLLVDFYELVYPPSRVVVLPTDELRQFWSVCAALKKRILNEPLSESDKEILTLFNWTHLIPGKRYNGEDQLWRNDEIEKELEGIRNFFDHGGEPIHLVVRPKAYLKDGNTRDQNGQFPIRSVTRVLRSGDLVIVEGKFSARGVLSDLVDARIRAMSSMQRIRDQFEKNRSAILSGLDLEKHMHYYDLVLAPSWEAYAERTSKNVDAFVDVMKNMLVTSKISGPKIRRNKKISLFKYVWSREMAVFILAISSWICLFLSTQFGLMDCAEVLPIFFKIEQAILANPPISWSILVFPIICLGMLIAGKESGRGQPEASFVPSELERFITEIRPNRFVIDDDLPTTVQDVKALDDQTSIPQSDAALALSNDLEHLIQPRSLEASQRTSFRRALNALVLESIKSRVMGFKNILSSASALVGRAPVLLFVNRQTTEEQISETFEFVRRQNQQGISRLSFVCLVIEPDAPDSLRTYVTAIQGSHPDVLSEKAVYAKGDGLARDYEALFGRFANAAKFHEQPAVQHLLVELSHGQTNGVRILQINKPAEPFTIGQLLLESMVLVTGNLLLDFSVMRLVTIMA